MSQFDFATIDPNAKSGTQLAVDLNNWRDALHSGHLGAERPLYAQAGMLWVRETSSEQWDLMIYDGDTDFVLRSVNPTTNQLIAIPQSAVSGLESGLANLAGRTSTLESMPGLGWGQTWQDVTRSASTAYQNTTGRPILLAITTGTSSSGRTIEASADGSTWITVIEFSGGGTLDTSTLLIPNEHYWRTAGGSATYRVRELR